MMADLSIIDTSLASISASAELQKLLRELHTKALTEIPYVSTDSQPASVALERFVALEPDKCALVYLLLRSSGARYVVEAGTSFGLSTIYLALAVGQNAALHSSAGTVIATENEAVKASRAREHWKRAGVEIEKWIELREGDIRETLKTNLPKHVDFVLFDIWSYLALPTLKLVQPHLKIGAFIVADNIAAASEGYKDFTAYLKNPTNGFRNTVAPYPGGLLLSVYVGREHA